MALRLPVYVRELPGPRAVAISVDFPEVSAQAPAAPEAVRVLAGLLPQRLAACSASYRAALASTRELALRLVEVSVTSGESDAVAVSIGVVTWPVVTKSGTSHVVRAPALAPVDLAVQKASDIDDKVRRAVTKVVLKWAASVLVTLDEPSAPSLVWVDVDDPPPQQKPQRAGDGADLSLEEMGHDLVALAASGGIDRIDHRDEVVERVLAVLATPGRNSVLLVGPPAVGKSAVINEIAARIQAGEVPPALRGRSMWRITADELIAGAKYTGMWQDRARTLLARARAAPAIFAMGDPTAIVSAGRWSESDNNLSRVLRPAMETGEITIVCECTQEKLASVNRREPGFLEIFHRVEIAEPDAASARQILGGAADRLASNLHVTVEDGAVEAAVELTSRFEPYLALPGKAVRLLVEAVHRSTARDNLLRRDDVVGAFSERSGLPRSILSDEVPLDLAEATSFLERRVLGQPEAVSAMVDLVAVIKAGLHDPRKPLGSYFFVGPTGVGKTELAKALAELLFGDRGRMVRFDMGEYRSGDAVAKLLGSGWQREDEGELARLVREQPFSVVLLDEIEKAHQDVFDALLSVLGEGRLTDATGRTSDFRNTVVVMTSNLGAGEADAQSIGFAPAGAGSLDARRAHFVKTAEQFFRPEFFNRIDRIVVFGALERDVIRRIARREIGRLVMREGVTRRQLLVEIDDAVVDRCAERGFHPRYGARPLQREIERAVAQPLARIVVSEGAASGELVRFRVVGDEVTAELHRPEMAVTPAPRISSSEKRAAATIVRALTDAVELVERLRQLGSGTAFTAVRDEASLLLDETHEPGFWDDQTRARDTLTRYYQLNGCLERHAGLARRAAGLADMLAGMQARGDKSRLPEARAALDEIDEQSGMLELEIHGAAAGSPGTAAVLSVRGVGPESEGWAAQLLVMYQRWAERTGRDVAPHGDDGALLIDGLASYQLLRGERGLHRRVSDHGPSLLARVAVARVDAPADEAASGVDEIVRQYQDGRRQSVIDPRTGARATNVRAVVLEGKIDVFLLDAARAALTLRG